MTLEIEKKITEQLILRDEKIIKLEEKIADLECKLESVEILERKLDDQEQYSRRSCLRLCNVEATSRKTSEKEDCIKIVKDVLDEMQSGLDASTIDRAHRIGPIVEDKNGRNISRNISR